MGTIHIQLFGGHEKTWQKNTLKNILQLPYQPFTYKQTLGSSTVPNKKMLHKNNPGGRVYRLPDCSSRHQTSFRQFKNMLQESSFDTATATHQTLNFCPKNLPRLPQILCPLDHNSTQHFVVSKFQKRNSSFRNPTLQVHIKGRKTTSHVTC